MSALKYRPNVDGLRALAVLAVLCYHLNLGVPGGFVGVDIFFVISGFLITSLILKDIDAGTFSMAGFWERRIRRIMPAAAVMICATLIAGWFILLPSHYRDLGNSALAQAGLSANIYFWSTSGYFAGPSEFKPLLHTWSLAVEEQFYLFFPLILLVLARWSRKHLLPILTILAAASFAACILFSIRTADTAFYLFPMRAWELLMGGILAIAPPRFSGKRPLPEFLAALGLLAMLAAMFGFSRRTLFPGYAAMLPCAGATLFIAANASGPTLVGRAFAWRPVVFIGLISYSLYLWHWPLLVLIQYRSLGHLSLPQRLSIAVISLALAVLSWRFVETPFRKKSLGRTRKSLFSAAIAVTVLIATAGLTIAQLGGIPSRVPAAALQYATFDEDRASRNEFVARDVQAGDCTPLGDRRTGPIDLLVWGDSHAMAARPVFDTLCREYGLRGAAVTHSSTAPLLDYVSGDLGDASLPLSRAVIDLIQKDKIKNVFLVARWNTYLAVDGTSERLRAALLATARALENSGTTLWVLRPVPTHDFDVPTVLAVCAWTNQGNADALGTPIALLAPVEHQLDTLFAGLENPNLHILNPMPLFCTPAGLYRASSAGRSLFTDSHHLTRDGAMMLRPLFEPIFVSFIK